MHLDDQRIRRIKRLVTAAMFMEILDGSIITTALPAIAHSFGRSPLELGIGISAYLLALAVFIPVSGWVADRVGTRTVFASAIGLFTLASVLCGLAQDLPAFVATRVLQGVGGAMMVPVGRLLVLRFTPKAELMGALAALVWPALIAPVVGPVLGGFITTHLGWRWVFFINVPFGLLGLLAAWVLVPNVKETPRPFDTLGFVLAGGGLFALLLGLERLPVVVDSWAAGLVLAGLALLRTAVWHLRRSPHPVVQLDPFQHATFRTAARGGAVLRMAIGSVPFLLPLMFQVGFGYGADEAGLLLLAVFAGNLGMKTLSVHVLRRFGYRQVLLVNGFLCMASLVAIGLLSPATPLAITVLALVCSGMARSMQFTTTNTLAYADIPQDRMADANGLFNTISQVTMAASVTLGAMATRLAEVLCQWLAIGGPGVAYRLAFVGVAAVGCWGLWDAARLPKGAGDHFISKGQGPG